jgi:hypothetical protein
MNHKAPYRRDCGRDANERIAGSKAFVTFRDGRLIIRVAG